VVPPRNNAAETKLANVVSIDSTLGRRMTTEREAGREKQFIPAILPWIIAAGALLLYLLTLNHWVSFGSLELASRTAGWTWKPDIFNPLTWLVTLPIRHLPPRIIPLALNVLAAVCAALTLGLLARSVALLPHDRTHEQRQKERGPFWILSNRTAWLPPIAAALVCGLQLTFWEHATAASANTSPWGAGCEMLALVLFAYVIRCVLEFRISQRDSWLYKAAFVYGIGMTSNWAMTSFLPLFLVSLVWLRGLAFFNSRFLVRIFLCGLAGLSLFLLMPIVQSRAEILRAPFWQGLKFALSGQKFVLGMIFTKYNLFFSDRPLWVLALPSLLPLLLLSIRWPSYFGDTSKLGIAIATFTFHLVHGILFLLCLWVALDPPVSPRMHSGMLPFLTLYYVSALCVGYFCGYFLLIFDDVEPVESRPGMNRPLPIVQLARKAVLGITWAVVLLVPLALVYKNLPEIRLTNGPQLKQYASNLATSLPTKNLVVLSDDPRRLALVRAALAGTSTQTNIFVDTSSMEASDYHRMMKKKYGDRWPVFVPPNFPSTLGPDVLQAVLKTLAGSNSLYYLHPSFGYYFEVLNLEPHGPVYKLNLAPTNNLLDAPVSQPLLSENEAFWNKAESEYLRSLTAKINQPATNGGVDAIFRKLHVTRSANADAVLLGGFYSRALDYWGVELQKAGELTRAAARFELAEKLKPDNVVAKLNLECNHNLQAGRKAGVKTPQAVQEEFGKYRDWQPVMTENGPFDEPNVCFQQAVVFVGNGFFRQAANLFKRVATLEPDNISARIWLAQLFQSRQMPDEALKVIDDIHSHPETMPVTRDFAGDLLFVEMSALLAKQNDQAARTNAQQTLQKYPNDQQMLGTAVTVYMNFKRFTNALELTERQLSVSPDEPTLLLNKGYALLQMSNYDRAIPAFSRVLTLETNNNSNARNTAQLNRAISYLKGGEPDKALHDYEALEKLFPNNYAIDYGLQEIYYQKHDTNAAIRYCQLYLNKAPNESEEAKAVYKRLKELKPGYP